MSRHPRLSVGMPVYNGAEYIREALDSILSQTFEDFELFISDNASTDATEDIYQEYAARDPRIRYERQPENLGASFNFNHVFRKSVAPYFRWANHDDVCAPTHFERCLTTLEQAPPEVALVYTKTVLIGEDGSELEQSEEALDLRDPRPDQRLRKVVERFHLQTQMYGVIRSDVLRNTRLLDAFMSSDEVLLAELALLGQLWELPEPLFYRRMHAHSSVKANPDARSRTLWFDPSAKRERFMPHWKVYSESLRSIARLPLEPGARLRSVYSLSRGYLPRYWRIMAREILDRMGSVG